MLYSSKDPRWSEVTLPGGKMSSPQGLLLTSIANALDQLGVPSGSHIDPETLLSICQKGNFFTEKAELDEKNLADHFRIHIRKFLPQQFHLFKNFLRKFSVEDNPYQLILSIFDSKETLFVNVLNIDYYPVHSWFVLQIFDPSVKIASDQIREISLNSLKIISLRVISENELDFAISKPIINPKEVLIELMAVMIWIIFLIAVVGVKNNRWKNSGKIIFVRSIPILTSALIAKLIIVRYLNDIFAEKEFAELSFVQNMAIVSTLHIYRERNWKVGDLLDFFTTIIFEAFLAVLGFYFSKSSFVVFVMMMIGVASNIFLRIFSKVCLKKSIDDI